MSLLLEMAKGRVLGSERVLVLVLVLERKRGLRALLLTDTGMSRIG